MEPPSTTLVDTGVLYALEDKDDEHHLDAKATMFFIIRATLVRRLLKRFIFVLQE